MTMTKILALVMALTLGGCATCERYPITCAAAGAFVAGSVAYTIEMHSDRGRAAAPAQAAARPSFCGPTGALCQ